MGEQRSHKREWKMGEQLSSSQDYVWSAAPTNSLLYGCEPGTISTTVWDDLIALLWCWPLTRSMGVVRDHSLNHRISLNLCLSNGHALHLVPIQSFSNTMT